MKHVYFGKNGRSFLQQGDANAEMRIEALGLHLEVNDAAVFKPSEIMPHQGESSCPTHRDCTYSVSGKACFGPPTAPSAHRLQ